jgi:hypothetical protein
LTTTQPPLNFYVLCTGVSDLKFFVLTIFVLFYTAAGWAQTGEVFNHPLSGTNDKGYRDVCGSLAGRSFIKGTFKQTRTVKSPGRQMVSTGDFIIAADLGIVWITKTPAPSTTTMGRDFIIQSVQGKKKSVMDVRGNDTYINMADTMKSLFTGNAQMLTNKFDNYFLESQTSSGKSWILGLVPREKAFGEFAQWIVLEGSDKGSGQVIDSMILYDRDGGSLAYLLSHHTFPADLEPDEKAFFSVH